VAEYASPDTEPAPDAAGGPDVAIGDVVLYMPPCPGDCAEFPHPERAAWVHGIYPDGTLGLTVLHRYSVAMVPRVPHDPDGAPGTWHLRPERSCTCRP